MPDGRTPKPKAKANGSGKKRRRGRRRSEVIDTLEPPPTERAVEATLQTALADIERAGKAIRAIQASARRVFGS